MAQNYKIFINEIPLLLCNDLEKVEKKPIDYRQIQWDQTDEQLLELIAQLEEGVVNMPVAIQYNDVSLLWRSFRKIYKRIEAAGGVVSNNDREILMIFRRGKWDLPKGKIDEGETPEQAALREIEEETGVAGLTINGHLTDTYHTYILKGKRILKKTWWYDVSCSDTNNIKPQIEEDIEVVKWISKTGLQECFKNTYSSIKDVLDYYLRKD